MDIFSILKMAGGLALFLFGMNIVGEYLAKLAGGRLERILEKLSANRIKGVLFGALVTGVIQSSSATTVMVVGFVNSGIMKLTNAVGIIMGANIGTTVTSWILSLAGISGDNIIVKLLKPSSFMPVLAVVGIIFIMSAKQSSRKKDIGTILLGFAVLMFGMETMSSSVASLANNPDFTGILTVFSNPLLGVMAGALLTAIIQSSSASVGILQALCLTGSVTFGTAIPIIMGQNIGTCITAVLSSIGATKNAKRTAAIHLSFNLIGTACFMLVFYLLNTVHLFGFLNIPANTFGIAIIHTLFNLGTTALLLPFANQLVKLSKLIIPGEDYIEKEEVLELPGTIKALDEKFLKRPAFAVNICRNAANTICTCALESITIATELIYNYNEDKAKRVILLENIIDKCEDRLGSFLVKISGKDLSDEDTGELSVIMHATSDFERISDNARSIVESLGKMRDNGYKFSKAAKEELTILIKAVDEITLKTADVFVGDDVIKAKSVEPIEEVIDGLNTALRNRHITRMRSGECSVELGIILEDIITALERVSDRCSDVAACILASKEKNLNTHAYVNIRLKQTPDFISEVEKLSEKYALPQI